MEHEVSHSTILKNMMSLIISMISAVFFIAMITLYKHRAEKFKSIE